MKLIFTFSFLLVGLTVYSQYPCLQNPLNFEDSSCVEEFIIDTISNPANIWQVGNPDKEVFSSAYSAPNAVVTDTANSYPPGDTSVFIIKKLAGMFLPGPIMPSLSGRYWVDSDTLTDYGTIEFSPDNGETWINLINDTVYSDYYSWDHEPTLSGTSNGWQFFHVNLGNLGFEFDIQDDDTVQYRFTFISDSIDTARDGLMFDDLVFLRVVEGLDELGYDEISSTSYPNPAKGRLTIDFENLTDQHFELRVFDEAGRTVISRSSITDNRVFIDTQNLRSGVYIYSLVNHSERQQARGRVVIGGHK